MRTTSTADSTWTTLRYPLDYGAIGSITTPSLAVQGIQQLQNRHQLTTVLEKQQGVWRHNSTLRTGGQLVEYTAGQPWRFYDLTLAAPGPSSPLATIESGALTHAAGLDLREEVNYRDRFGNALQVAQKGQATSFIWGYRASLLLAQVKNAEAAQIGYAGFEEQALGNWTGSVAGVISTAGFTGRSSYQLREGQTLLRSLLPPKQYIASV